MCKQNPSKAAASYAQHKKNQHQAQAAAAQQVAMGYSNYTLMQQLRLHEKLMQHQMQQGQHVSHNVMTEDLKAEVEQEKALRAALHAALTTLRASE
ncbi:hypothetical protein PsorP6_010514 [Peronosclerospora sorghi]|uniref:Uncharacterized protein n=1 Tax=Peronosclerospora sorghi TaxID=230839 RepID=A0ACC0VUM7_9STRA|nr:hypothetical protein PsorP6_010514 [Peronosclerospora sorghi]